jgi:hypothetical protein
MSNSWDPPLLPRRGDDSASVTHEWFGRVVGQWVHVEFQLALLYSLFVGRPRHGEALKEFGAGVTFRQRLDRLRSKAVRFFAGRELTRLETEFQAVCMGSRGVRKAAKRSRSFRGFPERLSAFVHRGSARRFRRSVGFGAAVLLAEGF